MKNVIFLKLPTNEKIKIEISELTENKISNDEINYFADCNNFNDMMKQIITSQQGTVYIDLFLKNNPKITAIIKPFLPLLKNLYKKN